MTLNKLQENLIKLKDKIHQSMDYLNLEEKRNKIKALEKKTGEADFWKNTERAGKIASNLNEIKDEIKRWEDLKKEVDDLFLLLAEAEKSKENLKIVEEAEKDYQKLIKVFQKYELEIYLGKKYDKRNALLFIYAGAGGIDAQDWTGILMRMYHAYARKKNFSAQILDQSFGEEKGFKNITLSIKGKYAYGLLKNEGGVHRLIRISPFSAQSLRHTSFALVEVLPEIEKPEIDRLKINPQDLKLDTFRSSGPGGQNVNRRETAIRITHLPTGLSTACQTERSQGLNREKALSLLYSKIIAFLEKEHTETLLNLKTRASPEWGSQIRTYVFHPYHQIRDHRTKIELADVERVLNGDLDDLIEANLKKAVNS